MRYSQSEVEALLQRLSQNQTESTTIDGKADLPLDTIGDRAFFIRHAAALANNGELSHLIIGVEDKTWAPLGLPENSPLRDADNTQTRLNQILANRLDPNLSVQYRTYQISGVMIGLVVIEGKRAPYVVAIDDQQYGGARTRGEPSYIYRGIIYVRHGSNSIIANRQSEIFEIINKVQGLTTSNDQPDKFLTANNYLNPEAEDFGRHELSNRLEELRWKRESAPSIERLPAQTWVSFVTYPVDRGCQIDTVALKAKLKPDQRIGRGENWYQDIPRSLMDILWDPRATPREFLGLGTWLTPQRGQNIQEITHFIRIQPSGQVEFGCTDPLVSQRDNLKAVAFVSLTGYLWQILYLSKSIYQDAGFYGSVAILLNLIGTRGTILADFARSRRGGWASPFDPENLFFNTLEQMRCTDPNIQIERRLALAAAYDDEIEDMVRGMAQDLGAYYGQDRPRCFDYHTNEFPYKDYRSRT